MTRVAIVTGGNRGIGLACARALASSGHTVVVASRSGEAPDGFESVACDVTSSESVDAAFDEVESRYGAVGIAVANAGITHDTLLLRMTDDDVLRVIDTNLMGAIRVARRASRSMIRQRWGRIVLMSSVVGMTGSAGQVNYAASKAGLVGVGRSLARELGSRGITANIVAPGFVETDMTATLDDDRRSELLGQIPLARYASADEIAATVDFLCSDQAGYITGALIPVDGGLGMGH